MYAGTGLNLFRLLPLLRLPCDCLPVPCINEALQMFDVRSGNDDLAPRKLLGNHRRVPGENHIYIQAVTICSWLSGSPRVGPESRCLSQHFRGHLVEAKSDGKLIQP